MCQSATFFQIDERIKTTLSRKISLSTLEFDIPGTPTVIFSIHFPATATDLKMERLVGLPGSIDQLVPVKQHEVRRFIIIIAIIVIIVPGTVLTAFLFLYRKRRGGSRSPLPSLEEAEPPVRLRGPLPVQPSFWLGLGRALSRIQEVEEIGSDMEL